MLIKLTPGLKSRDLELLRRKLSGLLPGSEFLSGRGFISVHALPPELLSLRLAGVESLGGVVSAELSLREACPLAVKAAPPELAALFKKSRLRHTVPCYGTDASLGGTPSGNYPQADTAPRFPLRRGNFILIAGPCAVEDEASYRAAAKKVKAAGACAIRAGLFKPRTSPYAFQGLGTKGFGIVEKITRATGLPAVIEATSESQLSAIKKTGGIVQIGARNMRNYELLKAAARARLPVMLKRAPGATLKEWLLSAEYLLKYGNGEVLLCERGDSFARPDSRGLNLDILRAALNATALPVIADPSHATGDRALVPAQALAAVRAGADGLMLETAVSPETALMDGRQTLSLPEFTALIKKIKTLLKNG